MKTIPTNWLVGVMLVVCILALAWFFRFQVGPTANPSAPTFIHDRWTNVTYLCSWECARVER